MSRTRPNRPTLRMRWTFPKSDAEPTERVAGVAPANRPRPTARWVD